MSSSRHEKSHKHEKTKRKNSDNYEFQNNSTSKKSKNEEFTFTKFKHELNKIFSSNPNLLQDPEDFWIFLKKYETIKKKTEKSSNSIKINSLNLKINIKFDELFSRINKTKELNEFHLKNFKEIILLYLDFKQKEKFTKLKKLRENQLNLPVSKYKDEIIKTINNEKILIIAGDTGCGKSTQIPQYLYSSGFKKIACTQPRRIACISLSKRVAFETLTENKNEIGYQIRFDKKKNSNTKITFITEGLLLRQISTESELSKYDVIVLDEIHERHLYGDFLLGIMKCLIHQRNDLKLILMSATINIELFKNYFSKENVKIIQIPGRLYPIKLIYRPIKIDNFKNKKNERFDPSPYVQIMQIIDKTYDKNEKGDLLIFLSGISEITSVIDAANEYSKNNNNNWIILGLHSTLSLSEQDKVFDYPPDCVRKCIVSTNIAETSITIDGIRFVIDSGKVKELNYDPICKIQKLKEFWISKASAEQRKGRAGRTGPGICYRIYSEDDYNNLEKYSLPEIQRVSLDSLLLQMMSMGLPDPRKFPFIELPSSNNIENSILSLKQHDAITINEKLTLIGKTLSKLPVDITIGKILIIGSIFHQIQPILSISAALSVQNPFTNRYYNDNNCDILIKKFESDHGDPIILLNAYKQWLEIKNNNDNNSNKWCKKRGLEEQRFYEITKLRGQFKDLLKESNLLKNINENNSKMTSNERTIRHGELKLLKSLKINYNKNSKNKRKKLKINEFNLNYDDDDNNDNNIDIKDIEFRITNDSSKIKNLLNSSTACNYNDLIILKLILSSGLYPQYSISDEFNYCKSNNEQLFHTKLKPYVSLHPMSFFGNNSKLLQIDDIDIIDIPGFKSKTPISSKHQLIFYLSLLETTKPYLVNTMRMPLAQTLFLFSHEIDTNSIFSMFIIDYWLLLEFPIPDSGMNLLIKAIEIRKKWNLLINKQLNENLNNENSDIDQMEFELSRDLIEFINTNVLYTYKRLLSADLKNIYVGCGENFEIIDDNPFDNDFKCLPNDLKGGIKVNNYITYNCLIENNWSNKLIIEIMEIPWKCKNCNLEIIINSIEKLKHIKKCNNNDKLIKKEIININKKINSKEYNCTDCNKTFNLTPIEILKHKKKHNNEKI